MPREPNERGFELSEEAKNIMIMLFIFFLVVFFIFYKKVYGAPSDPSSADDF